MNNRLSTLSMNARSTVAARVLVTPRDVRLIHSLGGEVTENWERFKTGDEMRAQVRGGMKRTVFLVGAFVVIQLVESAGAQEPEALEAGSHIRIQTLEPGSAWVEGRFLKIDQGSLHLRPSKSPDTLSVLLGKVSTIERRRGHGLATRMGVGAGFGLLAGVIVGTVVTSMAGGDPIAVGILGLSGGGFGLVIGALVGIAYEHAHWEAVPQSRLSFGFHPVQGGFTVGIVLRGR